MAKLSAARIFAVLLLAGLALVPVLAAWLGQPFWVTLFTRVLIFALAAMGLNLVLGFGAMVSFGHAMYLGIGAYAVGILSHHGVDNGLLQLAAALAVGALVALGRRCHLPAHQRHGLHHDHAGLRTDAVLPGGEPARIRRRRRHAAARTAANSARWT